jgi:dTDP-4-amino-4,6-dideoxygalactose transaminase
LTPAIARSALEREHFDAVVPVAAFGAQLPVAEWDAFAAATGVSVVIDGAAALGTLGGGEQVIVAYSLHATKPLGIGEGGVIATADGAFATRVRRTINHGFETGQVTVAGTNARLGEFAAAVGLAQLARWPGLLDKRRALWTRYRKRLAQLPSVAIQRCADDPPAVLSVETQAAADSVAAALRRAGIETRRWYAPPLHAHPAFSRLPRVSQDAGSLPVAERLGRHAIGLPFHTHLDVADVDRIVDAFAAALRSPVRAARAGTTKRVSRARPGATNSAR